ncbi:MULTISPECIES: hypothetical protein [unclassified Lentimonas]|uniref:hypothetical protein n=1 Tax=unclassified Lentimonas TaxID=2630993 RepID=UPI00132C5412|nr:MULTISPECIES: hypothetical protein [unclassified Lentimonas]CAA6692155.1 Unannotated [Lentimonas sp. CC19]CAA6697019.1 Unannotated [Lentimonas sp. CC10]CAA7070594.1 Unannotated [Lentimonas sp. CC11]
MMNKKTLAFSGVAILAASLTSQAAIIAGWDFGTPASPGSSAPTTLLSGVTVSTALDGKGGWNGAVAYNSTTPSIGDNTGFAASGTAFGSTESGNFGTTTNNANAANLAGAISGGDYISFALTADTAGTLNVSGFSVGGAIAGVKSAESWNILAQVDGGTSWTAAGALASDTTITATQSLTAFTDIFVDLSGNATFQGIDSVEFRIYSWGGSSSTASSRAQIDNLVVEGVIPEPSSYALLAGCLALTSVMIRRRRA